MAMLFRLLLLVAAGGVAVRLGLLKELGLSRSAELPSGAEAATALGDAWHMLGGMPEPFLTIATVLLWLLGIAAGITLVAALAVGVMRLVGWLRDALV